VLLLHNSALHILLFRDAVRPRAGTGAGGSDAATPIR
jgi:hypothetical protein